MRNYRVCDSIEAYAFEKALDKACEELEEVDKCLMRRHAFSATPIRKKKP